MKGNAKLEREWHAGMFRVVDQVQTSLQFVLPAQFPPNGPKVPLEEFNFLLAQKKDLLGVI